MAVAVAVAVDVPMAVAVAVAVEVPLASLLSPLAALHQRHTNCSVSDLFATGICPKANRPNRT